MNRKKWIEQTRLFFLLPPLCCTQSFPTHQQVQVLSAVLHKHCIIARSQLANPRFPKIEKTFDDITPCFKLLSVLVSKELGAEDLFVDSAPKGLWGIWAKEKCWLNEVMFNRTFCTRGQSSDWLPGRSYSFASMRNSAVHWWENSSSKSAHLPIEPRCCFYLMWLMCLAGFQWWVLSVRLGSLAAECQPGPRLTVSGDDCVGGNQYITKSGETDK